MGREYDVLVYGASGFTGERVAMELARLTRCGSPLKWAMGGRSATKLQAVRERVANRAAMDLEDNKMFQETPTVLADVSDPTSLQAAFAQASVVINCVGPYRFHGEAVVGACIAVGTDYVDITGEPHFMDRMALMYHEEAAARGVLVVHACGFDSIPADLGSVFCAAQFKKRYGPEAQLGSIESFLTLEGHPRLGYRAHYTTYECAVHGFGDIAALQATRGQLKGRPERQASVPRLGRAPVRHSFGRHSTIRRHCVPFPGSDASVVRNSQQLRVGLKGATSPQAHYAAYVTLPGWRATGLLAFFGGIMKTLARFGAGRRLLLAFPRLFTCGYFSHQGPSEDQMKGTTCTMTLVGAGHRNPTPDTTERPDGSIVTTVTLGDPGYLFTSIMVVEAARTLVIERESVGLKGGVLTPGVAFENTTLIDRLHDRGVQFSVKD